jgi:1-deoxy-D-xylulose-5-phosphate reductoisomerase
MNKDKPFVILGSTGSVGTQAIDVAKRNGLRVEAISANKNAAAVENQARQLCVSACAMADEDAARELKVRLADTNIKIYSGESGICEMIANSSSDTILNSIIGEAGLMPTLATIDSGKKLALANKESLVVAGETVMTRARKNGTPIIPVDSEHCAIHQCLKCGEKREVKKLILTASGGPFYGKTRDMIQDVTIDEVLAHPTWSMGAKITVDSATLMNKGFEVIEAMRLFDVSADQIDVVVHRESIIHSMVEYIDNSVIAQMSVPDMRACIQYAIYYPERNESVIDELDLTKICSLTFGTPDTKTFSLLAAAFYAAEKGGALPAVLNAANEVAVASFLRGEIKFGAITDAVNAVLDDMESASSIQTLEEIILADREARRRTEKLLSLI